MSALLQQPDRSRRLLLQAFAGIAGLGVGGPAARLLARPSFADYPFTLGVASGEPSVDGAVLWTRLAPDPLHGGGMPERDVAVQWQVAHDAAFARIVRSGVAIASPHWAHALHVEVEGLAPDRWYHYRFIVGDAVSPVGRLRTLPAAGADMARLRLAVASCQHYEQGYFNAYRHMLADDLDCIVHVGDYIYEGAWGAQVRLHESPRGAYTLEDYRNRHACYKRDPDPTAAHAAYPWMIN